MRNIIQAFATAALAFLNHVDAKHNLDNGIMILNESNFDETLSTFDHLLVEFYAPSCVPCMALAPKYEAAAKTLWKEGSKVTLAKVDGEKNPGLIERFEIRSYPYLLWFSEGTSTDFDGG